METYYSQYGQTFFQSNLAIDGQKGTDIIGESVYDLIVHALPHSAITCVKHFSHDYQVDRLDSA